MLDSGGYEEVKLVLDQIDGLYIQTRRSYYA